ncbi:DUF871 domain-containing protein [Williamsoniiplasma luminosum]|nr:MupG family TIM beta-alpha barrel fold protein [Williamsoniiplasma luminosum]
MQKKKVGITIYPEQAPLNETLDYLERAKKLGYELVFVSFVHLKKEQQKELEMTVEATKYASKLGYYVIADVAPSSFELLNVPKNNYEKIKAMGISCLRFDLPLTAMELAFLSHNEYGVDIQINMSSNDHLIDTILDYQPARTRISGCHNFYPQKNTALPLAFFHDCNQKFVKHNIETAAFIGSHFGNQGVASVNKELPTLEATRNLPCSTQAKLIFYSNEINNVMFGNAFASQEELEEVVKINRDTIALKVILENDITQEEKTILNFPQHFSRGDIAEFFIRSVYSRIVFKDFKVTPKNKQSIFNRGDVVIMNENGNSYKGEAHIILKDNFEIENNQYNLVGKIDPNEIILLDYVRPWAVFKFEF